MWLGNGGQQHHTCCGKEKPAVSVANPACVLPKDALNDTRDTETKLKGSQGLCNETMMALWEECKPCLKQTCMKFYARVCRSGSGLVGHQVEKGPRSPSSPKQPRLWVGSEAS